MMNIKLIKNVIKTLLLTTIITFFISCSIRSSHNKKNTQNKNFKPGAIWLDNNQEHINAHGGGILHHQGVYYWFGEHKTAGKGGNSALIGISCYSSKDLYNWKNEGIALQVVEDTNSEITKGCIMERPKVLYNSITEKFVMWFHLELKNKGYHAARTAVATSSNPAGPYHFIQSFRPNSNQLPMNSTQEIITNKKFKDFKEWWTDEWKQAVVEGLYVRRDLKKGQMSRDMTLFLDDDGKAYHIHSSEENLTLHISELSSDYLNFTGNWTRIFPIGHNEAPAIIKHDNKYYLITSGCTGWDPNAARSAVADSIFGPWKSLGNPCVGENSEITFNAQSTFILKIPGTTDNYIFMADRWNPANPIDGRYVWLPVIFENNKPVIRWHDEWDLSIFNQ